MLKPRGGNIERVKENMITLSEAKKDSNPALISIFFTTDIYTTLKKKRKWQSLSSHLVGDFQPVWAFFMPLEKSLLFDGLELPDVILSQQDLEVIASLALPLKEELKVARK